jgi:hypothetical protein
MRKRVTGLLIQSTHLRKPSVPATAYELPHSDGTFKTLQAIITSEIIRQLMPISCHQVHPEEICSDTMLSYWEKGGFYKTVIEYLDKIPGWVT